MPGEETETPAKPRKGVRAKVEVEGEVHNDVMDRIVNPKEKQNGGTLTNRIPFDRAIRMANVRCVAKRVAPATLDDGTPLSDDFEVDCYDEITEGDIKRAISESRGGNRWVARVVDENGRQIASKQFMVPGKPRLDPLFDQIEQGSGPPGGGRASSYFDPGEVPEEEKDPIEDDPQVIKAKVALKKAQLDAELEGVNAERLEAEARKVEAQRRIRGEDPDGKKPEPGSQADALAKAIELATAPLKQQLEDQKKTLDEAAKKEERKRDLEAIVGPLRQAQENQQKTLEGLLTKLNAPAPTPQGPSLNDVMARLDSLKTELKTDTTNQIANAITSLKTELNAQITVLGGKIDNRPATAGPDLANVAVSALRDIATKQPTGGAAQDPFSAMERGFNAMKTMMDLMGTNGTTTPKDLPTAVVETIDHAIPEIVGAIKEAGKKGEGITQETLKPILQDYGNKMYNALRSTIQEEVRAAYGQRQQGGQQATPAAPGAVAAPAPPQAPAGGGAVRIATPAAPTVPAPGQPVVVPPNMVQLPGNIAVKDPDLEKRERVNLVLGLVHRELAVGAREMKWPMAALEKLPRDVIEKIVPAETVEQIYEALKPWADSQLLDMVWGHLGESNPNHEWNRDAVINGINWLKQAATR